MINSMVEMALMTNHKRWIVRYIEMRLVAQIAPYF